MHTLTPDEIRRTRGKESQPAFAARLGTDPGTVSGWENGHHQPNRFYASKLRRMATRRKVLVAS